LFVGDLFSQSVPKRDSWVGDRRVEVIESNSRFSLRFVVAFVAIGLQERFYLRFECIR